MKILTQDADLRCAHRGKVDVEATQTLVTINGRLVLTEDNPENRDISTCPNYGAMIKPCKKSLKVQTGYSSLLSIDGKPVCLDTVKGLTDGTPPGMVEYKVTNPGQTWVDESKS
jgi:hypothetical protein